MVEERGFGVHKLWAELSRDFPHFNFEHGFGLGVLAVGREQPEAIKQFFAMANDQPDRTRRLFSALGHRLQCELEKSAPSEKGPLWRRVVNRLKP
jgi:O-antigen biosynthesis protein